MWEALNRPYPIHHTGIPGFFVALGTGFFVSLFLLYFRPFGLDALTDDFASLKIAGYGMVTFVVMFIYYNLLPLVFPTLADEKKWTLGKEIIFLNLMVLSIAAANVLYSLVFSLSNLLHLRFIGAMFFYTLIIAVFPITLLLVFDYNRLLRRHLLESQSIKPKNQQIIVSSSIVVPAEQGDIRLHPDKLLFIESLGNYASVVNIENDLIQKQVYRTTLKHLEENIGVDYIVRCHRSYLINLEKVREVSGNAQGLRLDLHHGEETIPVSRKYIPTVKAYFA